jgi:hypothetical protein
MLVPEFDKFLLLNVCKSFHNVIEFITQPQIFLDPLEWLALFFNKSNYPITLNIKVCGL